MRMKKVTTLAQFFGLVFFSFAPSVLAGSKLTKAGSAHSQNKNLQDDRNWRKNPRIVQIVDLYTEAKSEKDWITEKTTFEYCHPYADMLRQITRDKSSTVRVYIKEGGSDDSALKLEHYFDKKGILSFLFVTGGSVNGTELEHRIYFGNDGIVRLREDQNILRGPGYSFPKIWPDNEIERDPVAAFNRKNSCPVAQDIKNLRHN